MHPSTLPHPATPPVDEDLADQARPGYGIPSQDPRPGAQTALEPEDAEREAHSVLVGGGMMAGAAFCHNFSLAASAAGPSANGRVAVIVCFVVVAVITLANMERKK